MQGANPSNEWSLRNLMYRPMCWVSVLLGPSRLAAYATRFTTSDIGLGQISRPALRRQPVLGAAASGRSRRGQLHPPLILPVDSPQVRQALRVWRLGIAQARPTHALE